MNTATAIRTGVRWAAIGAGALAGVYAVVASVKWVRYGRVPKAKGTDVDELVDRFMPDYEVVERHQIAVRAPAAMTFAAAKELSLDSTIARLLFAKAGGHTETSRDYEYTDWEDLRAFAEGFIRLVGPQHQSTMEEKTAAPVAEM